MTDRVSELRSRIADLQAELRDLEASPEPSDPTDPGEQVPVFDEATRKAHAAERTPVLPYIVGHSWRIHLSGPFVNAMIIPIAFLDICLTIYQAICFRLWRIPRVSRSEFIVIDRHKLGYLNWAEKLNCIYCGYATGVFAYAVELTARTERFWCPIKHAARMAAPHAHYDAFIEFGDMDAWRDHPARKKPGRACEDCWNCTK